MNIWIDVIIILVIAIFTFLGYKRGLTGVIFKLFSFVIAIILSLILYKPVSSFIIEHTSIDDHLETAVVQMIAGNETNNGTPEAKKADDTPKFLQDRINQYIQDASDKAKEDIASYVAKDITRAIIHICTIILIFIITNIILLCAKVLSDVITNLPIISQFNTLGGIVYGILEGLIIIYVVLALISLFMPVLNNLAIVKAINASYLGSFLYNNNLLLMLLF